MAAGRMSQGLEPLLRRIVGKSPDPRDRIPSPSAGVEDVVASRQSWLLHIPWLQNARGQPCAL